MFVDRGRQLEAAHPKPLMAKDFKDERWDCPIRKSNITVISFAYIIPGELTCS